MSPQIRFDSRRAGSPALDIPYSLADAAIAGPIDDLPIQLSSPATSHQRVRTRIAVGLLLGSSLATAAIGPPAIGVLSPFLISEFALSRTHIGLLVTAVGAAGALLSPFAGRWADRLGWHAGFGLNFGIGIVAFIAVAVAPSYVWLVVAVLLSGLSNSFADPVTNRFIVETIATGRRGIMVGVKQAGGPVGVFIAAATLPYLALTFGWRVAAASIALLPLAGLILVTSILPARTRAPVLSVDEPGAAVLTNAPLAWGLTMYAVLMGGGQAVVLSFLPLYAHEVVGLNVATAGGVAALMGLVGIGTRIVWAAQAERLGKFSIPLFGLAGASVLAVALFIAAPVIGAWALAAGAVLGGASLLAWMAVVMITVVVAFSQHEMGKISGQVIAGFLVGYTFAPTVFAVGVDTTGQYLASWIGLAAICGIAACIALWLGRALPVQATADE